MITRGVSRVWWTALTLLAVSACGKAGDSPSDEPVSFQTAGLYSIQDPTTVTPGSPSPRAPTCPRRQLPDQCGSWAGVELAASRSYWPPRGNEDEHCLCEPIEFQVPASIPVTRGNAGIGTAKLQYRKANGAIVNCIYKGDAHFSRGRWVGGEEYDLLVCSSRAKAGDTATSDWFSLDVQLGDPLRGPTEIALRLGEPDVVDGVVQEQVFYASDPRIAGAALHVPRGAAPPQQRFSFDVLATPAIGTSIPNGGSAFTTLSPTIDVHADGVEDFHFTPVPGAQCARLELPYSQTRLEQLMGPGAEERVRARQITDLDAAARGDVALAQTGHVAVDPLRKTATFCVEHLSYYVTGSNDGDADLAAAYITATPLRSCTGAHGSQGTCNTGEECIDDDDVAPPADAEGHCYFDVLTTPPPDLPPVTPHRLRLEFFNQGLQWTSGNLRLVSVEPGQGTPPDALQRSPWFPGDTDGFSQAYEGANVGTNGTASFDIDVTTPRQEGESGTYPFGGVLNLCLQRNAAWLSHCFSFDPGSAVTNDGSTPGPLFEICDGYDNDGNNLIDDGVLNACGGCTVLSQAPGTACDNGRPANCFQTGELVCSGTDAVVCNAPTTGGENVCGGCQTLATAPGTACDNGRPHSCNRTGEFVCTSGDATACNAPDVVPTGEVCNGADDDCNGLYDDIASPESEKVFVEQFDWPISPYTKVFYPDYGYTYSSCTMTRTSGGGFGLLHPSDAGNCIADFRNGGIIGTEGGIFHVSLMQRPICESLRDVKLVMEGIDDDAYVWIGDPSGNENAICQAQIHANSGLSECNLTGAAKHYGLDTAGTWFTLKLGNSGGLMTAGQFTLYIDGAPHPLDRQFPVHAHSGWTHRQKFWINFQTGEVVTEPSSSCEFPWDCPN